MKLRDLVVAGLIACLTAGFGELGRELGLTGTRGSGGGSGAYQGPGDQVTFAAWGSCSRVYSSAISTGTAMCDVVDTATGLTTCTFHSLSTGFANPTECNATACATACSVTKVYDQTGGGNHFTQATLVNMPALAFGAINGLPAINCGSAANFSLATSATFTSTTFSFSVVYKRSTGTALGGAFGGNAGPFIGSGTGANLAVISNGTPVTEAATDNAWHGLNATLTSGSAALNVDGTDFTSLAAGASNLAGNSLRFCRAAANQQTGPIAEGGYINLTINATQRGNLYSNMHGSNGYNGAF